MRGGKGEGPRWGKEGKGEEKEKGDREGSCRFQTLFTPLLIRRFQALVFYSRPLISCATAGHFCNKRIMNILNEIEIL